MAALFILYPAFYHLSVRMFGMMLYTVPLVFFQKMYSALYDKF